MNTPKSEFLEWFVSQHGKRNKTKRTDIELINLIVVGRGAETERTARRLWDEKRQSALYAWSAKIYRGAK